LMTLSMVIFFASIMSGCSSTLLNQFMSTFRKHPRTTSRRSKLELGAVLAVIWTSTLQRSSICSNHGLLFNSDIQFFSALLSLGVSWTISHLAWIHRSFGSDFPPTAPRSAYYVWPQQLRL
jgi:hypothetical protein